MVGQRLDPDLSPHPIHLAVQKVALLPHGQAQGRDGLPSATGEGQLVVLGQAYEKG